MKSKLGAGGVFPVEMTIRAAILAEARTYIGTPFRHQGRVPGVGLDCVGVIVCLGRRLGLFDHDLEIYPRSPLGNSALFEEAEKAGFTLVPNEVARPGDVLLFRMERRPQHVALMTDKGILHAWLQVRQVVEHGLDHWWRSRIVAAYKFPDFGVK